jgi:arabinose-5-phosphate isomerase
MNNIQKAAIKMQMHIEAVQLLIANLDGRFNIAIDALIKCNGRIILLGLGKSGIIAKKIAATLSSTGSPAIFVHPTEAAHGDLGMIKDEDVVVMITNSGETDELVNLLPTFSARGISVISITGDKESTIAKKTSVNLNTGRPKEACKNNLAPTCSTTATLVLGDTIANILSEAKSFTEKDFARHHPGGSIGKKLLFTVRDLMRSKDLPICDVDADFRTVIKTITTGRLGLAVVTEGLIVRGVITDGDLRRTLERSFDLFSVKAGGIMTQCPQTIRDESSIIEAEKVMTEKKISTMIAVDDCGYLTGILQIYDLNRL